jgi:anti-sigma factor RsiW
MINQDQKLNLQAYLDDELSPGRSREVAAWLEGDSEARQLAAELTEIRTTLQNNELDFKLSESREFYWSKIERAIRQNSRKARPAASLSRFQWWFRLLAPAMGFSLLLMAAVSLLKLGPAPSAVSYLHEIETPLDDISAISFHSQSAGMTVVWVQTGAF